jgi:type IV pilus assembly protein PilM
MKIVKLLEEKSFSMRYLIISYGKECTMFFSRKHPLIGVDIGSHSIKLVQLKRTNRGYHLIHFGIMPLEPESIVDGVIMNAGAVVESLRNIFRMEKIKAKEVATAISGQSVIVKKIRVPQMTEKELAENIQWEAEQHIPFEISDVNIDFQILSPFQSSEGNTENQIDVLLVAAKKSKVSDYANVILEAGLQPVVVDTNVFALENEYEINNEIEDNTVALVDIGASTMSINILKGNITLFQRDIAVGGQRYTSALQKEFGIKYEQAEALKMGVGFTENRGKEKVVSLMAVISEEISEEIQRSLEFFRSTTTEEAIDKMVISGGCARIKGLDRFLSDRLGLPVQTANPFQNIHCNEKVFDPEYLRDMAPVAAVGVGLALRRMHDR